MMKHKNIAMKLLLTTGLIALLANGAIASATTTQTPIFSAYKDVGTSMNWWDSQGLNTYVMSTKVNSGNTGALTPVVNTLPPEMHTVTWAFATGDCTSENWAGMQPSDFIGPNVNSFTQANVNYILSTGGAAGGFTCNSGSGMEAFLNRYMSTNLVGIDFDIEGYRLTDGQITSLVNSIAAAKATGNYPNLRVSFTLASLASALNPGAQGSSINAEGEKIMAAIKSSGLTDFYINLMVMDYGDPAASSICVVVNGLCDMGQSAIQAAENFLTEFNGSNPAKLHVLPSQLELTPLIGENDISSEIFTVHDAAVVAQYVRDKPLAGLHHWSFDRDTSNCASGSVTTTCHGVPNLSPLQFTTTFLNNLY